LVEDLSQQRLPARTLAAVLVRAGWRVRLAHFRENADAIIALAQRAGPHLIIFSILFADRVPEHLALIAAGHEIGDGPQSLPAHRQRGAAEKSLDLHIVEPCRVF